jgi:DNA-binding NtrC family response regulator
MPLPGFIAGSTVMQEVLRLAWRMAQTDWPVLICGETGTGKECLARWIHRWSRRQAGPFLAVNCAALPESLAESELFGCERGSYTGATCSRPGYFERADGGTLLLDEISELPLALQGKLLRVLEEQQVQRLGSARSKTVSVRVLALSNRPLEALVRLGRFRADLLHRLSVLRLQLPALRQRREDIPLLAEFFLTQARQELSQPSLHFAAATLNWLAAQSWPGNVRQLRNSIFQAALYAQCCGCVLLLPEHFSATTLAGQAPPDLVTENSHPLNPVTLPGLPPDGITDADSLTAKPQLCDAACPQPDREAIQRPSAEPGTTLRLEEIERRAILEALRRTGGHRRRAAALLGISLRTLFNKLRRYQIVARR